MSLLGKASLIVTPNGYKAGKLYSVLPGDGSGDMTVVRATTATRINSSGLIESVGLNVPRIDYTNGSCPSLLIEPQRTNLLLRSETFISSVWNKTLTTFSGDTLTGIFGSGFKNILQLQNTNGVQSAYFDVQYISQRWVQILVGSTGADIGYVNYDIQNKVVGTQSGGYTGSIQDFGTFVRIYFNCNTTGKNAIILALVNSATSARAATTNSINSLKIFRSQLELGSYPTSYVPTVATSVTCNADAISKTGISSLIGQTEGVIYFENIVNFKNLSSLVTLNTLSNSTNSDTLVLYVVSDIIYADINIGFAYITTIALGSLSSLNLKSSYKIAIQYNSSGIKTYNNGVLIQTVSTVISNYSAIRTGSNAYINNKATILFKQYLTDAECIALTTL
jgi:hypothetical protein